MGELVLLAYLLDLNEPGVVRASGEEVLCKMIKILFSSLEIIPNKPSCLRWRMAGNGREPEMKKINGSGVFLWSFSRPSSVHLYL